MSEIGKAAKHMGHEHPRVLRKIDPVPPRPTPRALEFHPIKRFGYQFKYTSIWMRRDRDSFRWYRTAKARDQAMDTHNKQCERYTWQSLATKVDR